MLLNNILGGVHTQFPEASSTYPFLQGQNPRESNYLLDKQDRQS